MGDVGLIYVCHYSGGASRKERVIATNSKNPRAVSSITIVPRDSPAIITKSTLCFLVYSDKSPCTMIRCLGLTPLHYHPHPPRDKTPPPPSTVCSKLSLHPFIPRDTSGRTAVRMRDAHALRTPINNLSTSDEGCAVTWCLVFT